MIYIITHKKVNLPVMENYKILEVGTALHEKPVAEYLHDNTGLNISEKNPNYCELTGLYWIWKNRNDDYKGLVHYRRFFGKSNLSGNFKDIYSYEELVGMLDRSDIITSYDEIYKENAKNQILRSSCTPENFELLRNTVIRMYPDYQKDFDRFFSQNKAMQFNMMFCRGKLFDEYCEWLFSILFEVEKHVDLSSSNAYQKRIYGFFGERLMNIWILHHRLTDTKLKIVNPESKLKDRINLIRRRCTNEIYYRLK